MSKRFRALARRVLGVRREQTYYLPWIARPGLECTLLLSNVEARFKDGYTRGPFPAIVTQYDACGAPMGRYDIVLRDPTDAVEVRLAGDGYGMVVVTSDRLSSDLYVTLSDGETYTATHGRHEFIERYPPWTAGLLGGLGSVLARAGRTVPIFIRNQYVYSGPESRSHVLLLNLSDVVNRIRVTAEQSHPAPASRLVALPPRGSHLLTVAAEGGAAITARRLHLEGNAWFNLYLVGAGAGDLAGLLSLMHVK